MTGVSANLFAIRECVSVVMKAEGLRG